MLFGDGDAAGVLIELRFYLALQELYVHYFALDILTTSLRKVKAVSVRQPNEFIAELKSKPGNS